MRHALHIIYKEEIVPHFLLFEYSSTKLIEIIRTTQKVLKIVVYEKSSMVKFKSYYDLSQIAFE